MLNRFLHTVFTLLLFSSFALGKTYSFKQLSVEDGLPSSEVYCAMQDNDGYMWFGTDRGVVRYDGYEFEVFTTAEGLPDNVVFQIQMDHNGLIWFLSSTSELSYYHNNQIKAYPYNHLITEKIGKPIPFYFKVDSDYGIHIGAKYNGYLYIGQDKTVTHDTNTYYRYNMRIIEKEIICYSYRAQFAQFNERDKLKITQENGTVVITEDEPNLYEFNRGAHATDGTIYFSSVRDLYSVKEKTIEKIAQVDGTILKIIPRNGEIWVCQYKAGISIFNQDGELTQRLLGDISISNIFEDNEGTIWATSLDQGVYALTSLSSYTLTEEDGLHSSHIFYLTPHKNGIAIIDATGQFTYLDTATLSVTPIHSEGIADVGRTPIQLSDDRLLQAKKNVTVELNNLELTNKTQLFVPIAHLGKDTLFGYNRSPELVLYDIQTGQYGRVILDYNGLDLIFNQNFLDGINYKDDLILLYGKEGIVQINTKTKESLFWQDIHPLFGTRISKIIPSDKYDFVAATRGQGLLFVKDQVPYQLRKKEGLLSNQTTTLFIDEEETNWVGSSEGLSIVDSTFRITNLRTEDGLISNEITDILVINERAYVGTKKGLTILDKNEISKETITIPVLFKSINLEYKKKIKPHEDYINISHKEPFLNVSFVGISYRSIGRINYRYRLQQNDSWQYTTNTTLLFNNLAPGDYDLEIQASNGENGWNGKPAILHIYVTHPFWQTTPFYLIAILVILSLLFIAFKLALRRIKNKELVQQQIQNLRFEALNAQMNPHFMFNSLNAIQNYIMRNERKASIRYLSKFAKLMRLTLNHSQSKNITLHEELSALELYMELERLRFDYQFDYKIIIEKGVNVDVITLPALLIQPIVENAILHGIRPSEQRGSILIRLDKVDNDMLEISVKDNGIGRDQALKNQKARKKGKHISKGNTMTRERVILFARDNKGKCDYQIIDHKTKGQPTGTEVIITLPIIVDKHYAI